MKAIINAGREEIYLSSRCAIHPLVLFSTYPSLGLCPACLFLWFRLWLRYLLVSVWTRRPLLLLAILILPSTSPAPVGVAIAAARMALALLICVVGVVGAGILVR